LIPVDELEEIIETNSHLLGYNNEIRPFLLKGEKRMFIDFLSLIMINLVAGTAILAYYIYAGLDAQDQRPYAAAFGIVGLLGVVLGLVLSFTWPLPGAYNVAFGETTTLFGAVFLATGFALSQGWDLLPVAIYGFFAGVDAVVVGIRIISLGLTQEPIFSGLGFILAGLGGVLAAPGLKMLKSNKTFRLVAALVLVVTAGVWAFTFYNALWGHMAGFAKWLPATMGK
jgi:putative membrane protein